MEILMKKIITTMALLISAMICSALTITTTNHLVLSGDIIAKRSGSFYVSTDNGIEEVSRDDVKSIMDGKKDLTMKYFARNDYGTPVFSNDALNTLSYFEREMLKEMKLQTEIKKKSSYNAIIGALIWTASYAIVQKLLYDAYKL